MKTVLISGGSDGLGKALAQDLVKDHTVIILSHDEKKISAVAKEISCDYVVADLTDYSQIEKAVAEALKKHSPVDVLVNNAGVWIEGSVEENSAEDIQRAMDVNATGTILLTKAVLPHMKGNRHGRIINVISQAGINAKAERAVYNASKWAITGFTKSLALELVPFKVTVTGVYPGSIKTQMFAKAGIDKDPAKFANYMEPADVVRALRFVIETPDDIDIPELGIKPAWG